MDRSWFLPIQIMLIASSIAAFSCCSTVNQDSPLAFVDSDGNHPDGWTTAHGAYALPGGSLCMDCHGGDLDGGISGISCFTDALGCHSSGPAFHPADWLNKTSSGNTWHANAYQNGLMINGLDCSDCHTPPDLDDPADGKCVICHFTLTGSRSPGGWTHADSHSAWAGSPEESVCMACHDINISFGNQSICHNCHEIALHAVEYLGHNQDVPGSDDFDSQCSICHSVAGTSPYTGAPLCVSCHTQGSPYTQTGCTSCHGQPPGTGRHGLHQSEGVSCGECHNGAGTGSGLNHFYDGEVDVNITEPGFIYSGSGMCSGTCHGEFHSGEGW